MEHLWAPWRMEYIQREKDDSQGCVFCIKAEDIENDRVVLKLPFELAPNKAVICPLVKKDGLPERATKIFEELNKKYSCIYDEQGSIGKRYYRQDEAGTPYGITVDHQTMEDNTVTLRHRDTQKQDRIAIDDILNIIQSSLV